MSFSNSSILRKPSRTIVWSSASRTVIRCIEIQGLVLADSISRFSPPPPPRVTIGKRNLCPYGGALARRRFDAEAAADHLQPLAHADQSQAGIPFGMHDALRLKGFAVVFDFQANSLGEFL